MSREHVGGHTPSHTLTLVQTMYDLLAAPSALCSSAGGLKVPKLTVASAVACVIGDR